jgi:nucleoside-diphosphate-sugar epimerase
MAEILKGHFEGIKINYKQKDSLTPDRGTLNVDKACNLLGYQPENSIDVGYPKYIQWYKRFWDSIGK